MNKKTFLLTFVLAITVMSFAGAGSCLACNSDGTCDAGEDYNNCPHDCSKKISDVLNDAIDWLLTVATIISILIAVVGGIVYVGSSGDPETAKTAKKIVAGGLFGAIICGMAYSILAAIDKVLK